MSQHSFGVKTQSWPLVSSTDELIIVHRNQLAVDAVLYIGAHKDCTVEIRSATDRSAVETAVLPAVGGSALPIPAGGMIKFDLPGSGVGPLDFVSKITTDGQIYVHISSVGEFAAYFKQIDVPSI